MDTRWIANIVSEAAKLLKTLLNGVARGLDRLRARLVFPFLGVALAGVVLAGCNNIELYTNLDEQQANEMVATLQRNGVQAQRSPGKHNTYNVVVADGRFAEAVRVLHENGLPRKTFASLGEVFKKDGLISSPVQERAQMIYALSQELSHTVSDIDGVLSARVHLVLPENDPLRQQLLPSSASVFVRHRAAAQIGGLTPQIKLLVANGVAGLSYDKVSVVLVPVEKQETSGAANVAYSSFLGLSLHEDSVDSAAWLFSILIGVIFMLAGALGYVLWRRQEI